MNKYDAVYISCFMNETCWRLVLQEIQVCTQKGRGSFAWWNLNPNVGQVLCWLQGAAQKRMMETTGSLLSANYFPCCWLHRSLWPVQCHLTPNSIACLPHGCTGLSRSLWTSSHPFLPPFVSQPTTCCPTHDCTCVHYWSTCSDCPLFLLLPYSAHLTQVVSTMFSPRPWY